MPRPHPTHRGTAVTFEALVPWPDPVDGEALLDAIVATIGRYMDMAEDAMAAVALWILHAHSLDAWQLSPLLIISAPEKRSGKSTLGGLIHGLAPRAVMTGNITGAGLFHLVDEQTPTVIIDEADRFLKANPAIHAIINSGHTRHSAFTFRATGKESVKYSTWAPKVIIGIGAANLTDTLTDRAVVVELQRKKINVKKAYLRMDTLMPSLLPLRRRAKRWAMDNEAELRRANPRLPAELSDRARDNWRSLLMIAKTASRRWSERAFDVATRFGIAAQQAPLDSPGVRLLNDIREYFAETALDRTTTADLIAWLCGREEAEWATFERGGRITPKRMAALLQGYNIKPKTFRVTGGGTPRGYEREQFTDAFEAYLPKRPRQAKEFASD